MCMNFFPEPTYSNKRLLKYDFERALGVGHGQGSLMCCSPWGCKESDMTEQLN